MPGTPVLANAAVSYQEGLSLAELNELKVFDCGLRRILMLKPNCQTMLAFGPRDIINKVVHRHLIIVAVGYRQARVVWSDCCHSVRGKK